MRQQLIAGNWKMNGTRQSVADLVRALALGNTPRPDFSASGTSRGAFGLRDLIDGSPDAPELAVIPPAIFVPLVAEQLENTPIRWGGQDVSEHARGAYTGETAAGMLKEFGCTYVLVGHSERRQWFGDNDTRTLAKVRSALAHDLTPILCVGESRTEREEGRAESVVARQLGTVLAALDTAGLARLVVAYEPVWAIGTGLTATPTEAQAMHRFIRETVGKNNAKLSAELRILYGGSANATNATDLLSQADIDGLLVGGASLDAEAFLSIYQQAVAVSVAARGQ